MNVKTKLQKCIQNVYVIRFVKSESFAGIIENTQPSTTSHPDFQLAVYSIHLSLCQSSLSLS